MVRTLPAVFPVAFTLQLLCGLQLACLLLQNLHSSVDALSDDGKTLLKMRELWVKRRYVTGGPSGVWDGTDSDPCGWFGVRCNANLSVEALDVSGWSLVGRFDKVLRWPSLHALESLKELNVQGNTLEGALPDWVGCLKRLTKLDLSGNDMDGPIPPKINQLGKLRELSLEGNRFNGSVPSLEHLRMLETLNAANNRFSGSVPDLRNLTNLVRLDLSRNNFSGGMPSLQGLNHLTLLDLSGNGLEGTLDIYEYLNESRSLAGLKHFIASKNQLQGRIPAALIQLPSLKRLDLGSNNLSGEIPPLVVVYSNTTDPLEGTSLNVASSIAAAPAIPPAEQPSAAIQMLDLSNNLLVGSIDDWASSSDLFRSMRTRSLSVRGNQLSGDVNSFLALVGQSVEELRIGNNNCTGDIDVASLLRLQNLKALDLGSNFRVAIRSSEECCPNSLQTVLQSLRLLEEVRLRDVDLGGITLPDSDFSATLGSLKVLDLSGTKLVGGLSPEFFNPVTLPALQVLNLSNNRLSGPVPDTLTQMAIELDLSHNPDLCTAGPCRVGAPPPRSEGDGGTGSNLAWLIPVAAGLLLVLVVGIYLVFRWRRREQPDTDLLATLVERNAATIMPLRDLKKATTNFSKSCQIGVGGFGTVYLGQLSDGTKVAIKRSNKRGVFGLDKKQFLNEVSILSLVNHRHLVKLLGCCLESNTALLVFEYVSNGTLWDHLQGSPEGVIRLNWKQRLGIAIQTADALAYLHSAANPPIIHRDVKSPNILLDADLNAKVADFGLSKLVPLDATHVSTPKVQGTMGYIDPEYHTRFRLTPKSDVYSFGVVLLELISGQPVVDTKRRDDDASLVSMALRLSSCGDLERLIDRALWRTMEHEGDKESILGVGRLAIKCLATSSKERPSMKEVLKQLQSLWLQYDADCPEYDVRCNQLPKSPHGENQMKRTTLMAVMGALMGYLPSTDGTTNLRSGFCTESRVEMMSLPTPDSLPGRGQETG